MKIKNNAKERQLEEINDGDLFFINSEYILAADIGEANSRTFINIQTGECNEFTDKEILKRVNDVETADNFVEDCELIVNGMWN